MDFIYHDGGREAAGYKGKSGDCVCRSVAIVTGTPYREIYTAINDVAEYERISSKRKRSSARTGVIKKTTRNYIESLGYTWVPTMKVGQGCRVHLRAEELPAGRLLVSVSRHITAVIDGVIHDTHDCSRGGTRCVYGYYLKKN